jgi:hypothetical protein
MENNVMLTLKRAHRSCGSLVDRLLVQPSALQVPYDAVS